MTMSKKPFSSSKNLKDAGKKKPPQPGGAEKVVRLLKIYTLIAQNKYPSVSDLKTRFGVCDKTIYRYLETINMIDSTTLDKERKGYRFVSGDRIRKLLLSDDQLIMLLAMGQSVSHLGPSFKDEFRKFMESMVSVAKVTDLHSKIPMQVKIPDAMGSEKLGKTFALLSECIKDRRSVDLIYKTLHSGRTSARRIDPYGLIFYEGGWTLIAYCHEKEAIRHFAVDMINDLLATNLFFKHKGDFDIDKHLAHSWGVYDDKDVDVTIRFDASVADYIKRRDKWFPTEKRRVLPTGEIELSYTVAGAEEIKRWIYSWIPRVEVIKPLWFREKIAKETADFLKKHS